MTNPDRPSRQLVNELFGDSLPLTTRDERAEDTSEDEAEREAWLRENVPPHHG
jgi:hypothetical protein